MSSRKKVTLSSRPLVLILVAGIASGMFTLAGAAYLYQNSTALLTAGEWLAHTQEVLATLQRATRFTESVEANASLYSYSKDGDHLDAARASRVRLETAITQLKALTADNENQAGNLGELEKCSEQLDLSLGAKFEIDGIKAAGLRCHKALQLMTQQEQQLLQERNAAKRTRFEMSTRTEAVLGTLSLGLLCTLFTLLFRDSLQRTRSNRKLAATVKRLELQAVTERLIAGARSELQLCTTEEQVYGSAASYLRQLLPSSAGALYGMNSSQNLLVQMSGWAAGESAAPTPECFVPEQCCGVRGGQLRWRRPGIAELNCDHFRSPAPEQYLCIPLVAQGETLGLLYVAIAPEEIASETRSRIESVQQFVQMTGMTLAALRLKAKLEHQSIRDALTGLFNRHFMQVAFERELARAARRKTSLAVMMVDVDHFKRFNDQLGHAAGDTALKQIARVLQNGVRTDDIACRFGGEEFALILPEITLEAAFERAENVRRAASECRLAMDGNELPPVTISVGVAMFPADAEDAESLVKRADAALYRAKRSGRNQVAVHTSEAALAVPGAG